MKKLPRYSFTNNPEEMLRFKITCARMHIPMTAAIRNMIINFLQAYEHTYDKPKTNN